MTAAPGGSNDLSKNYPIVTLFVGTYRRGSDLRCNLSQKWLQKQRRSLHMQFAQALSGGTPDPIGSNPLSNFSPTEIVYVLLQITQDFQYSYLAGSGVYRKLNSNGTPQSLSIEDVTAFVNAVQSDAISNSGLAYYNLYDTDAPNLTLCNQCFVVVELDESTNVQFVPGCPGIELMSTSTNGNPAQYYGNLTHMDEYGNASSPPGEAPMTPPCVLLYFSAGSPYDTRPSDMFDYYVQMNGPDGSTYAAVDPCIKNIGNHPGKSAKRRHKRRH